MIDRLVTVFQSCHGRLGISQHGVRDATITFVAHSIAQAATTAAAIVRAIYNADVVALQVMTDRAWPRRGTSAGGTGGRTAVRD